MLRQHRSSFLMIQTNLVWSSKMNRKLANQTQSLDLDQTKSCRNSQRLRWSGHKRSSESRKRVNFLRSSDVFQIEQKQRSWATRCILVDSAIDSEYPSISKNRSAREPAETANWLQFFRDPRHLQEEQVPSIDNRESSRKIHVEGRPQFTQSIRSIVGRFRVFIEHFAWEFAPRTRSYLSHTAFR